MNNEIKWFDCNVIIYNPNIMQYITCACVDLVLKEPYTTYTNAIGKTYYDIQGVDMYISCGKTGLYTSELNLDKELMKRIKSMYVNKEVKILEEQINDLKRQRKTLEDEIKQKRKALDKVDKILGDNFDIVDDYYD